MLASALLGQKPGRQVFSEFLDTRPVWGHGMRKWFCCMWTAKVQRSLIVTCYLLSAESKSNTTYIWALTRQNLSSGFPELGFSKIAKKSLGLVVWLYFEVKHWSSWLVLTCHFLCPLQWIVSVHHILSMSHVYLHWYFQD